MLGMIVLILLVLFLVGAIPAWPHSRGWGYRPSGVLGVVLLVVVVLLLTGRM
ncbi:MAG TPA: DUF3309 family protein [Steroidobacteraceae bacterium]|jgi:hypothetical protein|nr:DUF3309 family protein [Steroidobacteraceae bacterium]